MTEKKLLSSAYHTDKWFEPGSWQDLMLVGAAIKLNVFVELAQKARDATSLADDLGLDKRATSVFLEALADAGYLNRLDQAFELTKDAKLKFGDPKSDDYLGWAFLHSWRLVQRWLTLPEVVKKGEPVPGDRFSEGVEGFIRAMDVYAVPTAEQVVEICLAQRPDSASVLDIGGATGTVSKVFSKKGLDVTLFDIPDVIDAISAEIKADFPSIKLVGGDFNESIPTGPFDIVFLGNVTHIYGPEFNLALYQRIFDELTPGGLIAILDFVRGRSGSASFFGVNMLVNTGSGGSWTEGQYIDWLTTTGFNSPHVVDLATRDQQLVLARK